MLETGVLSINVDNTFFLVIDIKIIVLYYTLY